MLTDKRLWWWTTSFITLTALLLLSDEPQQAPQLLAWFVFGSVTAVVAWRVR